LSAVVDTNVVAYYLLGTEPFAVEAREFWQATDEPVAPAPWHAKLESDVESSMSPRGDLVEA